MLENIPVSWSIHMDDQAISNFKHCGFVRGWLPFSGLDFISASSGVECF